MNMDKIKDITTDGSDNVNLSNCILIEYPDEDLYEDGELSDEKKWMTPVSEVEAKIIKLWRKGDITIAKWEDFKNE